MRVPTLPSPPLPGRRVHADAVLKFLRGIDAQEVMRRPAPPKRRPSQQQLAAVSQAALHTVVTAYEDVASELELLLAELAWLAPFAADWNTMVPEKAQVA